MAAISLFGDKNMAAVTSCEIQEYHPIQCLPFLCNTYDRQPSVRFKERLVFKLLRAAFFSVLQFVAYL